MINIHKKVYSLNNTAITLRDLPLSEISIVPMNLNTSISIYHLTLFDKSDNKFYNYSLEDNYRIHCTMTAYSDTNILSDKIFVESSSRATHQHTIPFSSMINFLSRRNHTTRKVLVVLRHIP